jgi:hypothetical protein
MTSSPAAFLVSTLLAAAQPLASNGAPAIEDVPVPGGIAAVARAIGVDPAPDPARLVAEIARLSYGKSKSAQDSRDSEASRLRAHLALVDRIDGNRSDLVPMPLPLAIWNEVAFGGSVTREHLFVAVMSDPQAALLARGLAGLDDETLRFFVRQHSQLLPPPCEFTTVASRPQAVTGRFRSGNHCSVNGCPSPKALSAGSSQKTMADARISTTRSGISTNRAPRLRSDSG